MYEGSVATADKIKSGNPHCMFLIVTETYDTDASVDIETSNIDNIYVLRKQRRKSGISNPIQRDVMRHMLDAIEERLDTDRNPVDDMIQEQGYTRQ